MLSKKEQNITNMNMQKVHNDYFDFKKAALVI